MNLQPGTRLFLGAFFLTLTAIAGLCGLIAVGLSMDRYMPGEFSPIFLVNGIDPDGADICLMGKEYRLETEGVRQAGEWIWPLRGLLPRSLRGAGAVAVKGMELLRKAREEEPELAIGSP